GRSESGTRSRVTAGCWLRWRSRCASVSVSDAYVPDAVQREALAERCSADPGPFQTLSLERSRLKAGTRVELCERQNHNTSRSARRGVDHSTPNFANSSATSGRIALAAAAS